MESRAELERRQYEQVCVLISAVAAANPFYRDRWAAAGAGKAFTSLEDFRSRFPFTCKDDLVLDQATHPPYGSNLTFPIERYTRCHGTSGSTASPLRWLDTPESWSWMLGNWRRIYAAADVTARDRIFFAFSFGPFLGFWTAFDAAVQLGCLCLPGGGMSSLARLRSLLEQKASVLCCTPTYALHLGEVVHTENVDVSGSCLRRIIVAGEPGGSVPAVRQAIEARWKGARVVDHHGMTEVGPVSHECAVEPGVLHVIETSYLAEIVDPRTGRPTGPGEIGELVLTTLGRVGSPLIRYRTGDLVRGRATSGACRCGLLDLALEGGILGRTDEMVVIRGVNVFPSAVDQVIRESGGVAEYRVGVHTAGALHELRVEIELANEAVDPVKQVYMLETAFQSRLGLRVPVGVVPAGTLPRFEMKSRRWVRTGTVGNK